MRQEAENRAKRDAEIKAELDQSRNNNKSEILELFDRVKRDLEQRKVDTGNYFLATKIWYTTTLVLIFKGHSNSAKLVLTFIHPQILNSFDP